MDTGYELQTEMENCINLGLTPFQKIAGEIITDDKRSEFLDARSYREQDSKGRLAKLFSFKSSLRWKNLK